MNWIIKQVCWDFVMLSYNYFSLIIAYSYAQTFVFILFGRKQREISPSKNNCINILCKSLLSFFLTFFYHQSVNEAEQNMYFYSFIVRIVHHSRYMSIIIIRTMKLSSVLILLFLQTNHALELSKYWSQFNYIWWKINFV